jgi:hypothetical protein
MLSVRAGRKKKGATKEQRMLQPPLVRVDVVPHLMK